MSIEEKSKKKRGFASLHPTDRSHVARLGGLASQKTGRAHNWNQQEARQAGLKGGARLRELYGIEYLQNLGKIGGSVSSRKRGYFLKSPQDGTRRDQTRLDVTRRDATRQDTKK